MSKQTKAAGYVRVSTTGQIDNESLTTQRESINQYCEANGYQLTKIYDDEGISGGTVKDRPGLLGCLHDAQKNKFDILVIHRLSRFGRNSRELLTNYEELKQKGIQLRSVKEGINFDNPIGKAMLTMLAAIAELEREMINERMLENRIAKSKKGIPSSGRLPFGRTFDFEKNEWGTDDNKKEAIQWAATQYLDGNSIKDIARQLKPRFGLKMSDVYLRQVLKDKCGNTWTVRYEDEDPITHTIPRLLPEDTIQAINDRIAHNTTDTRTDNNRYILAGFVRCEDCQSSLHGQTQEINGTEYKYYRHRRGKYEECNAFSSVPLDKLEEAVFQTIFENIYDVPSFEEAIKDSLPNEELINELQQKIKEGQKKVKQIDNKINKLVDAVLEGTLDDSIIKERRENLQEAKKQITAEIEEAQNRLDTLPDPETVKQEASDIRKMLKQYYRSQEHLQNMSFNDKKQLLHFLFDGKDHNDTPYGIYVMKKGSRNSPEIDYFMYGRLTGLRTIKGDDIDWSPEDDNNGDNGGSAGGQSTDLPAQAPKKDRNDFWGYAPDEKAGSSHKNKFYKTNKLSFEIFMLQNRINPLS